MAHLLHDCESLIRDWSVARPNSAPAIFRRMAGDCETIAAIEEGARSRYGSEAGVLARETATRYREAASRHEAGAT